MIDLQSSELGLSDGPSHGFVEDTKHRDDVGVFGLRDELGEDTNVVQGTLSVGVTHHAVQPVDFADYKSLDQLHRHMRNSISKTHVCQNDRSRSDSQKQHGDRG